MLFMTEDQRESYQYKTKSPLIVVSKYDNNSFINNKVIGPLWYIFWIFSKLKTRTVMPILTKRVMELDTHVGAL
jgi:hypothetical protein